MAYHEWLAPALGAFAGFVIVIGIALYVYAAWALMVIAQKTQTQYPWLAWIPVANLFLMANIAQVPWWTALIVLLAGWIPVIGALVSAGIGVWWWWMISERRGYEGWMGVLMIVPVVNLVVLGILAWKEP